MNIRSERSAFAPRGLNDGKGGNTSTTFFAKAGEKTEQLPSKYSGHIDRGGRLVVATPGAGGFGDPQARSRDRIKKDWLDESDLGREGHGRFRDRCEEAQVGLRRVLQQPRARALLEQVNGHPL